MREIPAQRQIPVRVLKRPRPPLETRVQRLATRVEEPNPLIPLIMHTIERGLQGNARQDLSDVDQIFDRAMSQRNVSQEALQQIVNNYRALPEPMRATITAPVALDASKSLTLRDASKIVSGWKKVIRVPKLLIPPQITGLAPVSEYGYKPGEIIKLLGNGFSSDPAANKVILTWKTSPVDEPPQTTDYKTLTPIKASSQELEVKLPVQFGSELFPSVWSGSNFIRVETTWLDSVTKKKQTLVSAKFPFKPYQEPPAPPKYLELARPEIVSLSPGSQLPGRRLLIEGKNIGAAKILKGEGQGTFVDSDYKFSVELIPQEGSKTGVKLTAKILVKSSSNSNGQLEVLLPKNLIPNTYWLNIVAERQPTIVIGSPTGVYKNFEGEVLEGGKYVCRSIAQLYEVRAFHYKVTFKTIHCIDESDPEKSLGANTFHDQIVTFWGIGADTQLWSKNSGKYGGFDDGETQSYRLVDDSVFNTDGSFGEVKVGLAISTFLYEWDEGDIQAAQSVLGLVQDIGKEMGKVPDPTVAAIGQITSMVAQAVSLAVSLLDDGPDPLGQRNLRWSTLDLQTQTDNPQRSFSGQLEFLNSDDEGSYSVTYQVERLEE